MDALRLIATVDERRVSQDQSCVVAQRFQGVAGVSVAGVGQHLAVGFDPDAVGLPRVADQMRSDSEGPDPDRLTIAELTEVELTMHAVRRRQVIGAGHPFARASGAVDRDPGARDN